MAGNGWAHVNWQSADARAFEADGELQLRDFQLVLPGELPWREPNLLVFLSAAGSTDFADETQLRQATLQVRAGTDRIDAELLQPVLDLRRGGTWPVKITAAGQLENWPGRIATWVDLGACRMAGTYRLAAEATASADAVHVRNGQLTAEQLQLATATLKLDEPRLEVRLAGSWDQARRRLHLKPASLTSSMATVTAGDLVMGLPQDAPPELSGTLEFRGRLEELQHWMPGPSAVAGRRADRGYGCVRTVRGPRPRPGRGRRRRPGAGLRQPGSGSKSRRFASRLSVTTNTRPGWCSSRNSNSLRRRSPANSTAGLASAEQIDLQLDGQLQYDLERIVALLRPQLGDHVRLGGRGVAPTSYRGPLALARRRRVAPRSAGNGPTCTGSPSGPGQLRAQLSDGRLAVDPIELTVSGGRVQMAPQVRLAPEPTELMLPPGPLATRVQITPTCATRR